MSSIHYNHQKRVKTLNRPKDNTGKPASVTPISNAIKRNDAWSNLLTQVGQQEVSAFEQIYDHFGGLLKGFYLNSAPQISESQAEELIQEVMCKIWTKAASFDATKSAASTWIYTIARNSRIDHFRKNAKHDKTDNELEVDDVWDESHDNQPLVTLSEFRNQTHVEEALAELPAEQKQCLEKMYMEGKSHSQLSNELGLPLGTVKSRIRLGLKRLQALFNQNQIKEAN